MSPSHLRALRFLPSLKVLLDPFQFQSFKSKLSTNLSFKGTKAEFLLNNYPKKNLDCVKNKILPVYQMSDELGAEITIKEYEVRLKFEV
jgi:hypothetical protein